MVEEKKKRGRPALSPEERLVRQRIREHKANKKWRENNPNRDKNRIRVTVSPELRKKLEVLAKERKVSIASLITDAVTEKYGNNT